MVDQSTGELTEEEKQKAIAFIKDKNSNFLCPICGHHSFEIASHVVEIKPYIPNAVFVGGPVYPVVLLICTNCGHVLPFSAIITTVLTKSEVESAAE